MPQRPSVVVFDINETLSDMSQRADRFADLGVPGSMAKQWFAALLRDGFALTAAGASEKFSVIGEGVLRTLLAPEELDRDLDEAVQHVMSGFTALPVHPDVPDGVRALRDLACDWSPSPTAPPPSPSSCSRRPVCATRSRRCSRFVFCVGGGTLWHLDEPSTWTSRSRRGDRGRQVETHELKTLGGSPVPSAATRQTEPFSRTSHAPRRSAHTAERRTLH